MIFKHQIVCHFSGGQGGVSCFRTDAGYMGGAVLYWHLAPIYQKKSVFIHQLLISLRSQCYVWPGSLRKTLCWVWSAGCCVFQLVEILRYRIEKMTSWERGGGFLFLDFFQYFASPPLFCFASFCFFKPLFCGRWKGKRNILAHFRVNFQIILSDRKETVYSAGKLIPEFNPCFNRHQNARPGSVFTAELEAKKHKCFYSCHRKLCRQGGESPFLLLLWDKKEFWKEATVSCVASSSSCSSVPATSFTYLRCQLLLPQ